jgi:multidrug efflux pump subunit AcrB
MFAFIIALGIVVDDAIVAGENIYEYRKRGMSNTRAAIQGARDIAKPISFSILTNIVAFLPLMFIPGTFGQIWAVIPMVVASVFLISWIEVLFILPTHIGYTQEGGQSGLRAWLHHRQQRFSEAFTRFIQERYRPFLARTVEWRYTTATAAVVILVVALSLPLSGRMGFILMPSVESDQGDATVVLPVGSPEDRVFEARDAMVAAAERVIANNGGDRLSQGVYASVNENRVRVRAYLQPPEERPISTSEMVRLWREEVGSLPGAESIRFESDRGGPGGGPGISVELSHSSMDVLDRASAALAARLEELGPVTDIDDGFTPGKRQFDIELNETARASGLTTTEVGNQIRNAFYGAEALRFLRGRDEVRVLVRRPDNEQRDIADIEDMLIRLPDGGYAPLTEVASLTPGRAYTSIERRANRRTVTVTANVEPAEESQRILGILRGEMLPQLMDDHPGLTYSFVGRQESMRESIQSFFSSVTVALLIIYALLAIPFRSYIQPLIIMTAIPFGIVGAILGHQLMGYSMSIISIMGIIALGGVVVNTSLVMLDYANARKAEGLDAVEAVIEAGVRRFRPIMLTTLTTFGGLAPMIFETSRQARFMIPMAISLGYGILFAASILLILIPSLYAIADDARRFTERLRPRPTE